MAIAGIWRQPPTTAPATRPSTTTSTPSAATAAPWKALPPRPPRLPDTSSWSNLCRIYHNNKIIIEGATSLAFSEDVATGSAATAGMHHVDDANDLDQLTAAFDSSATRPANRP